MSFTDVEPEASEDVNLKNLERFLQSQSNRVIHHTRSLPHLHPPIYEDDLEDYQRQRQKNIIEALLENPKILEMLENNKIKNLNYQQRPEYNIINDYQRSIEREDSPYVNLESPSNTYDYPKVKIPYSDESEKMYYSNTGRIPMRMSLPNWRSFDTPDLDDSLATRLQDNIVPAEVPQLHHGVNRLPIFTEKEPEFTYSFDQPNMKVESTFAVKPNDPKYYERDVTDIIDKHTYNKDNHLRSVDDDKQTTSMDKIKFTYTNENGVSNKFANFKNIMPEPQRRADRDPIVTSSNYKVNNDVYFIGEC